MRRRVTALWLAVPLLVLLLSGCSKQAPAFVQVEMTLGPGYKFTPDFITLKAGQPVMLVVRNRDFDVHDFVVGRIDASDKREKSGSSHRPEGLGFEPDLHVAANPGMTGTLEFTPRKAGTYAFFCTLPGHREAGMVGILKVT